MAIQDHLSALVERIGRPISILRNAGNIADYCILLDIEFSSKPFMQEIAKNGIFAWNSEIVDGDIFKDTTTDERFMVVNANFWVHGSVKDGKQALVYKCNDNIVLYALTEAVTNEYGKKQWNWYVKVNDYAVVSYFVKGDTLKPIGDVSFDKLFITFSGRNLLGYIPKQGDRIVLQSGKVLQIDGIDDHLYAGCYETICSIDQRA